MISKKLRVLSAAVVTSFLFQDLSFAALELKPTEIPLFQTPLVSFELPKSIATIGDTYKGSNPETIILVQDAHTNDSAQINTSKALNFILQKEEIPYVYLEAASGNSSLAIVRDKAPLEKRKQVAMKYLRKGTLDGVEYLDMTSDNNFIPWGVEDKKLYLESLHAYEKVAKNREKFQVYLNEVARAVETLKPQIYGPSLQEFDQKRGQFLKGKIALTDYIDVLMKQMEFRNIAKTHYPHLLALSQLKEKEKSIDFDKANDEQMDAIGTLSEDDQQILDEAAMGGKDAPFRLSVQDHKTQKAFYALLEEKLEAGSSKLEAGYPELAKYFGYLKDADRVDAKAVLEEQRFLEEEIYDSLIKTSDERDMHKADTALRFLQKLFDLTVTPDEFRAYKKDKEAFDIKTLTGFLNRKIMDLGDHYDRVTFLKDDYDEYVKSAEAFYRLTYERDLAFLDKMFDKMKKEGQKTSVLVTGGYHTPNLTGLLQDKNASYIVVTPQVLNETNKKRYESLLMGQNEKDILAADEASVSADKMDYFQSTITQMPALQELGITRQALVAFRTQMSGYVSRATERVSSAYATLKGSARNSSFINRFRSNTSAIAQNVRAKAFDIGGQTLDTALFREDVARTPGYARTSNRITPSNLFGATSGARLAEGDRTLLRASVSGARFTDRARERQPLVERLQAQTMVAYYSAITKKSGGLVSEVEANRLRIQKLYGDMFNYSLAAQIDNEIAALRNSVADLDPAVQQQSIRDITKWTLGSKDNENRPDLSLRKLTASGFVGLRDAGVSPEVQTTIDFALAQLQNGGVAMGSRLAETDMRELLEIEGITKNGVLVSNDPAEVEKLVNAYNVKAGGLLELKQKLEAAGKKLQFMKSASVVATTQEDVRNYLDAVKAGKKNTIIFAAGRATRFKLTSEFDVLGISGLTPKLLKKIETMRNGRDFVPFDELAADAEIRAFIDRAEQGVIEDLDDLSLLQRTILQYRRQLQDMTAQIPDAKYSVDELMQSANFTVIVNESNMDAAARQLKAIQFGGMNPSNVFILLQPEVGGLVANKDGQLVWSDENRFPEGHGQPFIGVKSDAGASYALDVEGQLVPLGKALRDVWRERGVDGIERSLFVQVNDLYILSDIAAVSRWKAADALMDSGAQMVAEVVENKIRQKGGATVEDEHGNALMRDSLAAKDPALADITIPDEISRMFYFVTTDGFDEVNDASLPAYISLRNINGNMVFTREFYSGDTTSSFKNSRTIVEPGFEINTMKEQKRIPAGLNSIQAQDSQPGFKESALSQAARGARLASFEGKNAAERLVSAYILAEHADGSLQYDVEPMILRWSQEQRKQVRQELEAGVKLKTDFYAASLDYFYLVTSKRVQNIYVGFNPQNRRLSANDYSSTIGSFASVVVPDNIDQDDVIDKIAAKLERANIPNLFAERGQLVRSIVNQTIEEVSGAGLAVKEGVGSQGTGNRFVGASPDLDERAFQSVKGLDISFHPKTRILSINKAHFEIGSLLSFIVPDGVDERVLIEMITKGIETKDMRVDDSVKYTLVQSAVRDALNIVLGAKGARLADVRSTLTAARDQRSLVSVVYSNFDNGIRPRMIGASTVVGWVETLTDAVVIIAPVDSLTNDTSKPVNIPLIDIENASLNNLSEEASKLGRTMEAGSRLALDESVFPAKAATDRFRQGSSNSARLVGVQVTSAPVTMLPVDKVTRSQLVSRDRSVRTRTVPLVGDATTPMQPDAKLDKFVTAVGDTKGAQFALELNTLRLFTIALVATTLSLISVGKAEAYSVPVAPVTNVPGFTQARISTGIAETGINPISVPDAVIEVKTAMMKAEAIDAPPVSVPTLITWKLSDIVNFATKDGLIDEAIFKAQVNMIAAAMAAARGRNPLVQSQITTEGVAPSLAEMAKSQVLNKGMLVDVEDFQGIVVQIVRSGTPGITRLSNGFVQPVNFGEFADTVLDVNGLAIYLAKLVGSVQRAFKTTDNKFDVSDVNPGDFDQSLISYIQSRSSDPAAKLTGLDVKEGIFGLIDSALAKIAFRLPLIEKLGARLTQVARMIATLGSAA